MSPIMRVYKGKIYEFNTGCPPLTHEPLAVARSLSKACELLEGLYPRPQFEVHEVEMVGEVHALEAIG